MINKKALLIFIGLTYGLTITLICVTRILGLTLFDAPAAQAQLAIAVSMFIPALSAIFVQKAILKKPFKELGFKLSSWKMYAKVYGVVAAAYVLNYLITYLFVMKPDLTFKLFLAQNGMTAPLPLSAPSMIALLSALTFIAVPIVNMIPSLGEEIGWRGFLLPNLEPLGKPKAALFSGMAWALWHTPMILILGFGYGREALLGSLVHFLLITGLGTWMGYIWFKTRDTVLASFIHAVFNANAYGIWVIIFAGGNRLLVGSVGVINTAIFLLLGWWSLRRLTKDKGLPNKG